MRAFISSLMVLALAAGVLAALEEQGTDAGAVLAAARQALGGEQKLQAVKTFVATGRTRQVRGNNLVPIEFEISCELPDKYVRRDEIPAQESGPTSAGFNGEALIQVPPPPEAPQAARPAAPAPGTVVPPAAKVSPPPAAPAQPPAAGSAGPPAGAGPPGTAAVSGASAAPPAPVDPRRARVTSLKQDFAKLTLGMFAGSFSTYPLTFTFTGQAEAPQGKADVLAVKGPGGFALRLLVDDQTHLPIMVSWTVPATNVVMTVPGQPAPEQMPPGSVVVQAPPAPGAGATNQERQEYAAAVQDLRKRALAGAKPVEYRIYYADYRDCGNGVRFPFRLRRAIAGETVEETNFDSFRINARIDARKFETLK